MGAEPEGALLHEQDLLGHPRAPELHEVRAARHRVHEVAVEAGRLRAPHLQPGAVPGAGEGQVHGFRGRLCGEEPNAVHDLPPF